MCARRLRVSPAANVAARASPAAPVPLIEGQTELPLDGLPTA
ncbi:hypothetical protein ACIQNU_04070 [Streptomyces sp. NPDC091292]